MNESRDPVHPMGGSPEDESLQTFFKKLSAGDSAAEKDLFEEYAARLARLAANNIQANLLKRFDEEDVVQSAFRTFFRRNQEGEFKFENSRQLWQLLSKITLFKTRSYARHHKAAKRSTDNDGLNEVIELIQQKGPDGESVSMVLEELELVLDDLPAKASEITWLRLAGHSKKEIGQLTNRSRQTVHTTLRLVYDRLESRFNENLLPDSDSTA